MKYCELRKRALFRRALRRQAAGRLLRSGDNWKALFSPEKDYE